jgi:hypothetical protein
MRYWILRFYYVWFTFNMALFGWYLWHAAKVFGLT